MAHQRSPAAADVQEGVPRLDLELAADQVHLVVLGLLERVGGASEVSGGIHHALAQEGSEEVVAAVVVLPHDPAVLVLGVDRDLGDEVRERPDEVLPGQGVGDEEVAVAQEVAQVARDVDRPVEVRLVERGHRDLAPGVPPLQGTVPEDDVVREGLHRGNIARRLPAGGPEDDIPPRAAHAEARTRLPKMVDQVLLLQEPERPVARRADVGVPVERIVEQVAEHEAREQGVGMRAERHAEKEVEERGQGDADRGRQPDQKSGRQGRGRTSRPGSRSRSRRVAARR